MNRTWKIQINIKSYSSRIKQNTTSHTIIQHMQDKILLCVSPYCKLVSQRNGPRYASYHNNYDVVVSTVRGLLLVTHAWAEYTITCVCAPVCLCVCPSHFLSTRLQVRPLNGFLQLIALKTRIYARMCLFGD